jgi:F-type H+-transporting ATPase subunit gamma
MRRPALILQELGQIGTIADLTTVFEGIASMEIAKVRDQTLTSKNYFNELWHIYSQLRVEKGGITSDQQSSERDEMRKLYVVVTSQGGLSGDIDARVVDAMVKEYDPNTTDVVVIGGHGNTLIAQRQIEPINYYRMPDTNQGFETTVVEPIIDLVMRYGHTMAYYQTYVSLSRQDVAKVELLAGVKALSEDTADDEAKYISERDYDFEPSLAEIVNQLESTMLGIVLGQVILESKLSQAASRFNAMAAAKQRAQEMQGELKLTYNRTKRAVASERTREITGVLRKAQK